MYPPQQPKKFSEKLENIKAVIARDYPIIIVALVLAIALHLYVRQERAHTMTADTQELATPRTK
jgi:hypothetical protein